jgi:hypothetical protein
VAAFLESRQTERNAFLLLEGSFTSHRSAFVEQPTRRLSLMPAEIRNYCMVSIYTGTASRPTHRTQHAVCCA